MDSMALRDYCLNGSFGLKYSRRQPDALRFLVASGMVGSLMKGDRDGSFRFWSNYRSILFGTGQPDLFFRMLAAESTKPN